MHKTKSNLVGQIYCMDIFNVGVRKICNINNINIILLINSWPTSTVYFELYVPCIMSIVTSLSLLYVWVLNFFNCLNVDSVILRILSIICYMLKLKLTIICYICCYMWPGLRNPVLSTRLIYTLNLTWFWEFHHITFISNPYCIFNPYI